MTFSEFENALSLAELYEMTDEELDKFIEDNAPKNLGVYENEAPCDLSGYCAGTSCPYYFTCAGA